MEYIENKTDRPSISIGQAFLIIGILLVVSVPVSLLQMSVLQRLPESKSWIMLFSYMLQFGATLLITVKIFNIKYFDTNKFKISVLLLSLVLIFALSLISESIASLIPMPDFIVELFKDAVSLDFAGFLTVGIAAPLLEELLFRGVILAALLRRYSPTKAIIWSAVIFGIAHLNPWQFIAAFIIGCAIGWLFWKTGSIWIGIMMHCANNSAGFLLGYLTGDINSSVTDYFGGPITHAIVLFVCVLASFGIFQILNRKIFETSPTPDDTTAAKS